jgi:flagellar biosynthesis protein FlhF
MEMYTIDGESRMDCELKIASKYNRPFKILSQKEVRLGGFFGMFSKPGIQVEFIFPQHRSSAMQHPFWDMPADVSSQQNKRHQGISSNNLEEEKNKLLAVARKNISESSANNKESSQQILEALKEIKEKVETNSKKEEHCGIVKAVELLKLNDFSEKYINKMTERLRKELSIDSLENPDTVQEHLLEWIGESINIYKEESTVTRKPRIMVLVGPTGVGKTTTIAKLAAIFGLGTSERSAIAVRMITIDAFRIGAKAQLESYGNIMQIPVSCVDNKNDLRKEIALYSDDIDLFLVDTIGKSHKDSVKLGEIKELLEGCSKGAEVHLVLGAGTKSSDIEDIMQQFEPFNYRSVVLTKMDETDRIGNVISALAEKRKAVSYITVGQKVPNDIIKASVVRFLINLDGFKVNRDKIENRFPSGEADQFKWS